MPQTKAASLFHKADQYEVALCHKMNKAGTNTGIRLFFKAISRLGDGVFWYCLLLTLPVVYGTQGFDNMVHILFAGALCVLIYSQLKNRLVRQRPFISFTTVRAYTAPLDLYSFPSGHTMNAVNFAILITYFYPPLGYLVIPFAFLVALSRVILGMHYPTDVFVGALIGSCVAYIFVHTEPMNIANSLLSLI